MKIPRSAIGKIVEVTWEDPTAQATRMPVRLAPKGRAALSSWKEYGVIDDITEGVVRICHSLGTDPPGDKDPEPEIFFTVVVEDLIVTYRVLDEVKQPLAS